jgi:hypothetical protein
MITQGIDAGGVEPVDFGCSWIATAARYAVDSRVQSGRRFPDAALLIGARDDTGDGGGSPDLAAGGTSGVPVAERPMKRATSVRAGTWG